MEKAKRPTQNKYVRLKSVIKGFYSGFAFVNDWKMEDIYSAARDGNVRFVRQWLDNVENDLNQGYVCGMSWPTYLLQIQSKYYCGGKENK